MLETILSMDLLVIASFAGAGILLNLTPGADVMFAMASGLSGGWRSGVAASVGITLGGVLHVTFAVLGISAAIAAIPNAFDIIRYLGAAYLAWLAVKAWQAAPIAMAQNGSARISGAILRGFWTNILNPKVALFILAFLPQFADPAIGPVWHQFAFLGAIFLTTGLVINAGYGAMAGLLGNGLRRFAGALNKITACVFGGLAVRLVMD